MKNYRSLNANKKRNKPFVGDEDIQISICGQVTRTVGVSNDSAHRILRKHKVHSYGFYIVQHLKESAFLAKFNFYEFVSTQWGIYFEIISFGQTKLSLQKNGVYNRSNGRYWNDSNHHVFI